MKSFRVLDDVIWAHVAGVLEVLPRCSVHAAFSTIETNKTPPHLLDTVLNSILCLMSFLLVIIGFGSLQELLERDFSPAGVRIK